MKQNSWRRGWIDGQSIVYRAEDGVDMADCESLALAHPAAARVLAEGEAGWIAWLREAARQAFEEV